MTTELLSPSYELVDSSRPKKSVRAPLRILDPGRTKLSTVETKRIISVLDETIFRIELVSVFSHVIENLDEFIAVLGPDLTGAFREHLRLSNILEFMLSHQEENVLYIGSGKGTFFGIVDPEGYLTLQVQGLKSSVRNILRLLYTNTVACQALRDVAYCRDLSVHKFINCLSKQRGFLFEQLLTTPLEEKEKCRFLYEVFQRDKKNTEIAAGLEEELTAAIQNRDEEISKKNTVIKDLKSHLHSLAKFSESQIQRTRAEAEKQHKTEVRTSQTKCGKLQQELQQLRAQFNALVVEDRESELNLRKKKYKVEMEIENWVQKYDLEMIEKQEEIDEIDEVYVNEKQDLSQLREKYARLDEEYCQIVEERRVRQEQKDKAEKELAILARAATLIQAVWKGYLVRSLLRSKRKKKGKGRKSTSRR
ncbi:dynein regulatory complex protein 10 [Protobothrops mucrosquamatus]|uniref:dynein regulatory complex protein 10 n=1 Tax=Protobothrops mucrosquamatus TaxID=103944 RepID=UPI000775BBAA|nr:dynein regulatory complex protein 10 [Protobothrops mucrosquamatus]